MNARALAFGTRIARSITARTGALLGGVGVATPIVAAGVAEILWGRPSSTSGIAFGAAIVLGALGAAAGAALGHVGANVVRGTRRAGSIDWPVAGVLLLLVAGIPSVVMVRAGLRREALNTPRVIRSTGEIVRSPGESPHPTTSLATFLWSLSASAGTAEVLWNGHPVRVLVDDRQLELTAGDIRAETVSLADFDYVREIYGVTATPTAGRTEFLALLLGLRTTGHRSLLLVFGPNGALVHQELLHRSGRTALWVAGQPGHQAISVDVGWPAHYSASP